jgi:hypothetical protein
MERHRHRTAGDEIAEADDAAVFVRQVERRHLVADLRRLGTRAALPETPDHAVDGGGEIRPPFLDRARGGIELLGQRQIRFVQAFEGLLELLPGLRFAHSEPIGSGAL